MLLKFYTAFVAALLIFPHSGRPQDTENVDTVSNDDASKATDAAHSTFDLVSRDSAGVENGDAGTTFNMTILHTNDIHSRILESTKRGVQCNDRQRNKSECYGGVARIANEVRKLKNLTQNPLFLNAGDFFQGTLWYSILKYNIVAAVMANMSYDTVCLGNHEFDDGPAGLVPFLVKMKEANVTVLGTNLDTSKEPLFAQENITLPKSIIYNISGTQVALLGVVTTETMTIAKPGGVVILSEADSINAEIARLKNESRVDIFILISHVGFDVDQILAEKCPDLDLIVGGHTNTFLYTGDPPVKDKPEGPYPYIHNRTNGGRCLIVQDYRFGKYLGYLELEIDRTSGNITRWSGNPILLNQSYTEDEEMLESLQPYKKIVDDAVKEVVGSTKVLLEANDKLCRYKECNAVNLMADAFFDYYTNRDSMVKNAWSIVNAAVLNGGIARDSIEQKGIRVIYNFSMPSGCRIMSLKVLCANCSIPVYNEVMENETYSIVTTTFIANGGDGFKFERTVKWKTEGVSATDALLAYIKKISPIKTPEEGRVITLDLPPKPENTTTSSPIAQPSTTADNSAVTMASVMSLNEWRSMRRNYLW
ncbi:protein 5NUC-like isoform X3 [Dermacentor silvarum]|uniref:protein 5NUC-like isoform X3 n=1 Tax=Dermacentor silvarum TaxID=543639 RepID=UPI002100AECD|nr:protein 5NUC-like isoform X3 [Dermacentor silvarum]